MAVPQVEQKSAKARQNEQGDVKEEDMAQSNLTPLPQQWQRRKRGRHRPFGHALPFE